MTVVIWSMMSATSLTLGLLHAISWGKERAHWANLAFAVAAIAVAAIALCELAMMRAQSVREFSEILRWVQVPIFIMVTAIVVFIRLRFDAGRLWLGVGVCGLRLMAMVVGFFAEFNVSLSEITVLRELTIFGGEVISVPVGTRNPWVTLSELSSVLLLAYVVDAMYSVYRRGAMGDRRVALILGGSFVLFIVLAAGHNALINAGVYAAPYGVSAPFICIVLVMGYSLGVEAARSMKLDASLARTEQRMDLALRAAGLGLWEWDPQTNSVWLTEQTCALFGVAPVEHADLSHLLAAVHAGDRDAVHAEIDRVRVIGEEFERDFRVMLPDGAVRWITSRGRVERNGRGRSQLLVRGVSMDITEGKQEEERFRLVVDASPNAVLMADAKGNIVLVNSKVETLFGYTSDELIGQPVEILIPEHYRNAHRAQVTGYFRSPTQRMMAAQPQLVGCRKDGTSIAVEIMLSPVNTSTGTNTLATVIDMSERERYRSELSQQRAELIHLSRVATVGELAGALAHELNQPLSAILSNAQAAQRFLTADPVDLGEIREILGDIVADDKRAGEVMQRLRGFLRKDAAKHEVLEPNEVVDEVLRLTRSDTLNRNVRVSVEADAAVPQVIADRVQLQQVLLNLVINGCQAMEHLAPQERHLTVRTSRGGDGGAEIVVSDCGVGIRAEDTERLFQPFFTTKETGMGLGLAVSRTIIENHGGQLQARNNADRGATFRILLPACQGQRA